MRVWRGAARGMAAAALTALAVTACEDTTINQHAGRDAKACVDGSACAEDESTGGAAAEETSSDESVPTGEETADDSGGATETEGADGDGDGGGATGGGSGSDSGTGSVEGVTGLDVPVSVDLAGGDLPAGLRNSPDGCWMGTCTDWNASDVVVGDKSFGTGFTIECTIGCGQGDSGYFEVKPAGKYARFDATFGIAADSPGNDRTATLEMELVDQGTGKVLYTRTLAYGKSYTLNGFDISGVGVLRISFKGPLGGTHGAVGSPVIRK